MKRIVALVLALVMIFCLTACGSNSTSSASTTKNHKNTKSHSVKYKSFEELENAILQDEEQTVADMTDKIDAINYDIGYDYDNYIKAVPRIKEWYAYTVEESDAFYERLNNYIIEYYRLIVSEVGISDYDIWTDKVEDAYNLWTDVLEDYYNAWGDLYEDNYDYYGDIIEDGYDLYSYDIISDVFEDMYDLYDDSWKKIYRNYDDGWDILYRNYNDIYDGFYDGRDNVDDILKLNEK